MLTKPSRVRDKDDKDGGGREHNIFHGEGSLICNPSPHLLVRALKVLGIRNETKILKEPLGATYMVRN